MICRKRKKKKKQKEVKKEWQSNKRSTQRSTDGHPETLVWVHKKVALMQILILCHFLHYYYYIAGDMCTFVDQRAELEFMELGFSFLHGS